MTLTIDNPEIDRLLRELATHTGETPMQALVVALRERLEREERRGSNTTGRVAELLAIGRHSAALPLRDPRTPDTIVGYDERGIPR